MCISLMVLFFVLYEVGFILFYNWLKANNPEMSVWVILGSKAFKLVAVGMMLIFVKLFTNEPLVRFGVIMLGVVLLSVLIEAAYCLKKNK